MAKESLCCGAVLRAVSGVRPRVAPLIIICGTLLGTSAQALTEQQILARFDHEPTVQQVQDAAIRYYLVHPDHIRSLLRGARLKALVPTISGEFANSLTTTRRDMNDGLYQTLPFKENERINGDALGWRIQASWVLDRLVFNPEVLDVQSLIGILDGVVREVTTIYYIRRRLQIDMILRPPTDLPTRISQRIRIEELTGLIDALTGKFMTKSLRRAHAHGVVRHRRRRHTSITPNHKKKRTATAAAPKGDVGTEALAAWRASTVDDE